MHRNLFRRILLLLGIVVLLIAVGCKAKEVDTMVKEAELVYFTVPLGRFSVPSGLHSNGEWTAQDDLLMASGISYRDMAESPRFFLMPGKYRIWVLHEDSGEFRFVAKDQDDSYLAQKLMAERPGITGGRVWESVDMSAEYPGFYGIEVWRIYSAQAPYSPRQIKAIVVTNDFKLTSKDLDLRLEEFGASSFPEDIPADKKDEVVALYSKDGMRMSQEAMNHTSLFSSLIDTGDFFILSSRQHPSIDLVTMVRAGLNADDIWLQTPGDLIQSPLRKDVEPLSIEDLEWHWGYYSRYGVHLTANHSSIRADGTGAWPHMNIPYSLGLDGRSVPIWLIQETREDARSRPSDRRYSIYYEPFFNWGVELSHEIVSYYTEIDNINLPILSWGMSNEPAGAFEYTEESIEGFQEWLRERHGSIDRLNAVWGTDYEDFDEVEAPENVPKAGPWVDWWQYNETVFARYFGAEAKARYLADPLKRPILNRLSDLDVARGGFVGQRTIDWEKVANEMLPWSAGWFCFHAYRPGDQLGLEMEYVRSIAPGARIALSEWNTHVNVDESHHLSSLWLLAARGARRITVFPWGGVLADRHSDWAKGLIDAAGNPKEKYEATAQFAYEVHRLEPLLMNGDAMVSRQRIAIFYPRVDLALGTAPTLQTWEEPVNGLTPVYAMFKQMGYWPEIITSSQIKNGMLNEFDVLVFANAQHLEGDIVDIVEQFVEQGGIVVGDVCTGMEDIYGRPLDTLERLFGVSHEVYFSSEKVTVSNPATGGTDLPTYEFKSIGEHRIKVAEDGVVVGRFSGFGGAGRGNPAAVVRSKGEGRTLYLATMLGSIDVVANEGVRILLQSFFDWAGMERSFVIGGLPDFEASSIRVEPPLVDAKGNRLVVLYNQSQMSIFDFQLLLPENEHRDDYKAAYLIDMTSRKLTEVDLNYSDGYLSIDIPELTIGSIVLLVKDSYPMISAYMESEEIDRMGAFHLKPGKTYTISIEVVNPSGEELEGLECKLYLPRGWYQDAFSKPVDTVKVGGQSTLIFTVQVPEYAGIGRYNPLVLQLYAGEEKVGTPCTLLTKTI